MRKTIKSLLLVAALSGCANLWAEDVKVLNVVAQDADGNAIAETPVSLKTDLRFSETGLEIFDDGVLKAVFNYTDMTAFSFTESTQTGISNLTAPSALALRQNPVADALGFTGFDSTSASLVVTDLKGETKVAIPDWRGEDIDVASLAPGLYLVTINKTTLKFIKK